MSQPSDIITHVQGSDPYAKVLETHRRLNQEVEQMNSKIDEKIDKTEGEFLVAYHNHLRKLKIQLSELKEKFDICEKELNKNNKIGMLEKQVILFREEALKLYDRLEQKTQEAQIYKVKSKQLEKSLFIAEKQMKDHIKHIKLLEGKLFSSQLKIASLEKELKSRNQKGREHHFSLSQTKAKSGHPNNLLLKFKDQINRQTTTPTSTKILGLRRKSLNCFGDYKSNNDDGQLKEWFLECVKTIKKDVAQRKNSNERINLDYITSIDEFKMVDKLKLLQKFMENEKLLTWMYQKIFPTQSTQVKNYFVKGQTQPNAKTAGVTAETIKKGTNQSQYLLPDMGQFFETPPNVQRINTKFTEPKNKRSEIRSRVHIKDGKLNLTHF